MLQPGKEFEEAYGKNPTDLKSLKLDEQHLLPNLLLLPLWLLLVADADQTLIVVFSGFSSVCLQLELCLGSPVSFSGTTPPPASPTLSEMFLELNLVREVPSVISRPENYKHLQSQPKQRILDNRPSVDQFIPPISLLYDGFGIFEDVRQGVPVPGQDKILERELWNNVGAFMEEMAKFHGSEAEQQSAVIDHLHEILHAHKNPEAVGGLISASKIGSRQIISDGHLNGAHKAMVFCFECKNELSNIPCEPSTELVSYIASSFREQFNGEHQSLFRGWRVPALGMTQIG